MVTTRRQASAADYQTRSKARRDRNKPAHHQEPPRSPKTLKQKRRHAKETASKIKADIAPRLRNAMSTAPQLRNHILFLFVGEARQLVTIHTELLPEATRLYIESNNEGQPIYQLPDEDFDIVQVYRLFLYTGRVYSMHSSDQDEPDNDGREAQADGEWMRLAHSYLFGVTVSDERFANSCITAIIEKMEVERYPTGLASEVYAYTNEGDALRRLIVDIHVYRGVGWWVLAPHDDANGPREFMQDVIGGLATANAKEGFLDGDLKMPWEGAKGRCSYHRHAVTARCED